MSTGSESSPEFITRRAAPSLVSSQPIEMGTAATECFLDVHFCERKLAAKGSP